MRQLRGVFVAAILLMASVGSAGAASAEEIGLPGTEVLGSKFGFATLWSRLDQAIVANGLVIEAEISASRNAAAHGTKIPGNAVVLVSRDDFAQRILQADASAGIEAPLRFYVSENADGTANLSYRRPSEIFAPYLNKDLDLMAMTLDEIFAKIAKQATDR